MSELTENEVQVEIQRNLAEITDVTIKIINELTELNDFIRENGFLDTAITNANTTLLSITRDMGINVAFTPDSDEFSSSLNPLLRISLDSIIEKISKLTRD